MTWYFHATPLLAQDALAVDDKRGAFDSPYFFAIHFLHFDDVEERAELFFRIGDQREGEFELGLEVLMRAQAVARHAEDLGAGFLELRIQVAELQTFGRAARRVVLWIEIQHHLLAPKTGQRDVATG